MTASTVLPAPAGSEISPYTPQAYGQAPESYGQAPAAPQAYRSAAMMEASTMAKGEATPQAYSADAVMSPPQGPAAQLAYNLSGLWVNTADEREVVEFTPDHYTTFYDGQLLVQEPMTYHTNCPGSCNNGIEMEIPCFTISGPAGTDCYGIIRLTTDVLEMSMLGVSTETIVYRKQ
jgi:hypothetical protein